MHLLVVLILLLPVHYNRLGMYVEDIYAVAKQSTADGKHMPKVAVQPTSLNMMIHNCRE